MFVTRSIDEAQHDENKSLYNFFTGAQPRAAPVVAQKREQSAAQGSDMFSPQYLMPLTMAYTAVMPRSEESSGSYMQQLFVNVTYMAVAYFIYSTLDIKMNLELSSATKLAYDNAGMFIFAILILLVWKL